MTATRKLLIQSLMLRVTTQDQSILSLYNNPINCLEILPMCVVLLAEK